MNPRILFALGLSVLFDASVARADDDPKLFPVVEFGDNVPQPGSVKVGFIDQTGKVVIPFTADYLVIMQPGSSPCFAEGLQPVTVGMNTKWPPTSWGYLDATGKFAIEPQFGQAASFSEGLAAVAGKGGRGYIDHTGKFVIQPQFQMANAFSGGAAVVMKTGDWHFGAVDPTGKWIVPAKYPSMLDFHEGLACVAKYVTPRDHPPSAGEQAPMTWGYIDKTGKQMIDFNFSEPSSFSEGLAVINDPGTCGYIDKTGAFAFPPAYSMGWDFSEGLARVQTKDGKMSYIDLKGNVVFSVPGLSWADPFSEGLAAAAIRGGPGNRLYGYIDHSGKFVIQPQFQTAQSFHNGLAQVTGGGETGYIDKTGAFVWKTKIPDMQAFMR